MAGALEGIRVVELANYVSGPYAGMLLGDLGAEVIKVELPDTGDPFRGWGRVEYSPTFGSVNRNKKSVAARPQERRKALPPRAQADPRRRRADRELSAPARWSGSGSAMTRLLATIRG